MTWVSLIAIVRSPSSSAWSGKTMMFLTKKYIYHLPKHSVTLATVQGQAGSAANEGDEARFDRLVDNAGLQRRAPFHGFPAEQWDEVTGPSLSGVSHVSRAADPAMVERGSGKTINTEMNTALIDDPESGARVARRTPARRWAGPGELLGTLVHLSSPASGFVTGQNILVGGMTSVP